MRRLVLVAALIVSGCQAQPRSASYFEAHPKETATTLADCARGARRGAECDNARAADGALKAKARQALFRKGFE
ncbi:MAG: EexN family lipoprotein [Alphaproteobacteria bacterium]|nr:EexN family lipoprotein [Alphaproteobacteria bacterium]MBU1516579.1 EexN family lipoprotein [Alphaproteobacteria bacterium]MBU2094336.1 EexN family lipoprotein [Alphaproteobacteria bacterium]MBU2154087.1 EexN family lipoprotein [Alphaproteobacteria bacterium]MBU2307506.1 EexN family lipoprotein [Alphaproteobacteria bacterium]